ncbi:MAG: MBL fold metallo-hydrolase [Anaerolineales bacterium]|nr:MBL fold metallo-hydrolase [Chloroflexota bacterium]MBL6982369.1 MBL fold metallo-hydrolase [Anaerolineales bacterium]
MDYSAVVDVHQKPQNHEVQIFESREGARIAQLPLNAFPDFWVYAYLVLVDDICVLIDTGSGFHENNQHLEEGFRDAGDLLGEPIEFSDLTHVLITHGHIDHYGGLPFVRQKSKALIGVHELDQHNLTHTEERLAITATRLERYLAEAGLGTETSQELVQIYKMTKLNYQPQKVDFTYEAVDMQLGPLTMLHVPGHCAGQVVIRLHDVLFSGDHVLSKISPHQAPERLSLFTGLNHYLQSLEATQSWSEGIQLSLGGHNPPVTDLKQRIREIQDIHKERLAEFLEILKEPHTIAEISKTYFGETHGYNIILALEEAGAHIEYLYERGQLEIANLDEVESGGGLAPICYKALSPA